MEPYKLKIIRRKLNDCLEMIEGCIEPQQGDQDHTPGHLDGIKGEIEKRRDALMDRLHKELWSRHSESITTRIAVYNEVLDLLNSSNSSK